MKKSAIIIDLDGTAVDSPQVKSPSTRVVKSVENIKEKYFVCSATGRVWSFAKMVLKDLNLTDPCIISAGTQICNPQTGEIIWQKNIPSDALTETIKVFKNHPDHKLLFNDATEDDYFNGGIYPKDFETDEQVYFLEQVFIPNKEADEIVNELKNIEGITCIMVVSQKPNCKDLHIVNKEATKEQAIAELLKMIDVKKENTIGVGDGNNDIHLFNAVDHKVAMGNAVDDLKTLADEVIGGVKEDGLAEYFEELANL